MKTSRLISILVLFHMPVHSQQLFQDGSGKTNLFLGGSPYGWITFNSSEKSGSIGYTRNRLAGYDHDRKTRYNYIYGGDVKLNLKDGLGKLVSSGNFNPGVVVNGNVGIFSDDFWKNAGHYATIYLRPSISYTQYSFIDSMAGGLPYIDKIKKIEGGVLLNVNLQFNYQNTVNVDGVPTHKRHYVFLGFQTGFNVANNYGELDEGQINTVLYTAGNISALEIETGKVGKFASYYVVPLNIDFGITPRLFRHNYFGFNSYLRSNFFKVKNDIKAGIGVYLADENLPSNISGGFAWQFNDVFDVLDKPGNAFEKSSIFFYIGYSIGR